MAVIRAYVYLLPMFFLIIGSMLISTAVSASTDHIDSLQKKLIDLRSIVDVKSEELSLLRQESKQKRKFLLSQISEVESAIDDRLLVMDKMNKKLMANKKLLSKGESFESLENDLISSINALSQYVYESLPFKKEERLAALTEIKTQLLSKSVSAPRLANKLWAFVEDEFMLTKGNGIYRQIIHIDDEDKLVDVARVGMLLLYYRDGVGNVGMAMYENNAWVFNSLSDKTQIHQVHYLFDSFQKQIRFGEFILPNGLINSVISGDS